MYKVLHSGFQHFAKRSGTVAGYARSALDICIIYIYVYITHCNHMSPHARMQAKQARTQGRHNLRVRRSTGAAGRLVRAPTPGAAEQATTPQKRGAATWHRHPRAAHASNDTQTAVDPSKANTLSVGARKTLSQPRAFGENCRVSSARLGNAAPFPAWLTLQFLPLTRAGRSRVGAIKVIAQSLTRGEHRVSDQRGNTALNVRNVGGREARRGRGGIVEIGYVWRGCSIGSPPSR